MRIRWCSRPVRSWILLLLGVLLGWVVLAWGGARLLLTRDDGCSASTDALLVLAGSRAHRERAELASRLYHAGAAPRILLTHDGQRGSYLHSEERNPWMVERTVWALQGHGVPPDRISILPEPVHSTRDEAALLAAYAGETGLRSLLVVTSGYHVRRARWTFRQSFAELPVRLSFCGTDPAGTVLSPAYWWVTPAGWEAVAGEYVRFLAYLVLYRRSRVST